MKPDDIIEFVMGSQIMREKFSFVAPDYFIEGDQVLNITQDKKMILVDGEWLEIRYINDVTRDEIDEINRRLDRLEVAGK